LAYTLPHPGHDRFYSNISNAKHLFVLMMVLALSVLGNVSRWSSGKIKDSPLFTEEVNSGSASSSPSWLRAEKWCQKTKEKGEN